LGAIRAPAGLIMKKFINGELPLTTSFWGFYFTTNFIIRIFLRLLPKDNLSNEAGFIIYLIYSCYLFFTVIGAWKSATNYSKNKKKKKISGVNWGIVAQVWLTLTIISQLFIISLFFSSI